MAEGGVDLRRWFSDRELELCPRCNLVSALSLPRVGFVMCLECGFFDAEPDWRADLRLLEPPPTDE